MANWDAEYNASRAGDGNDFDVYMDGPEAAAPIRHRIQLAVEPESQLEQLMRHWINERHAPDILPAQDELLRALLDRLKRQTDTVQLLRGDPNTSEEEHVRIMLADTEVARVKFIINSYERTRLFKIEKYARAIVADEELQSRLTAIELQRATSHARITEKHLWVSVLQSLPETQQEWDNQPDYIPPTITLPDKTRPVFAHALVDCPPVRAPGGKPMELKTGSTTLVPYYIVENFVARGEVELV